MKYAIAEVFASLQGEGHRAGERSVFVRFAGCNLWNGDAAGRARGRGACARWCDTDFGARYFLTAEELAAEVAALWPCAPTEERWLVLTGGEPMLQVDGSLLHFLHERGWSVQIETNGTVDFPGGVDNAADCVTCSPKRGGALELMSCTELKVVLGTDPEAWREEEVLAMDARLAPTWRFVQPCDDGSLYRLDGPARSASLARCLRFVETHPEWALSLQTHKILGLR